MNKAIVPIDFDTLQRMAIALFESNYFNDVKSKAQAITKVMAGHELGVPPFASMAGIHVIQGKPTLGANLIATLVKNDLRYDYRVQQCNNEECVITWLENGQTVGNSSFTYEEAQGAGLTGKDNWKKYTSDMLFARALTRGARRYAPGIFGGAPVYTPEELGADVDPDGYVEGEIIKDLAQSSHEGYDWTSQTPNYDKPPVADYPGDTIEEQVAEFKDNGKPTSNKIADVWLWVEEKFVNDSINLGILADGLIMTGEYKAREHVANWLNGKECKSLRDAGLVVDFRRKVSRKGAGEIWNMAIERKAVDGDNE